ncbi:MAG TPA: PEP/pyruvate-binding domain-containing protein [Candidatus Saccharimonadales bacterium]
MDKLLPLKDAIDVTIVGGKASALAALLRAGFRVPNGFVLPANASRIISPDLEHAILRAYDDIGGHFVAVRSSAINEDGLEAAWAGQLDTFLNCSRSELMQKIQACRQSSATARAQSYAKQKGIATTHVAVIVQEMIDSDVSGVAFSLHPITGSQEQVVIEAGLGLGEAVVSGLITPDTYVVNKADARLLEKHVSTQDKKLQRNTNGQNIWQHTGPEGAKQKLAPEHITEISSLTQELALFFKYPIDMEWAIKDGTVYVLQCRPITTAHN